MLKTVWIRIILAIILQQIILKTELSVLFDAVKTENVQHMKEKVLSIKRLLLKKSKKKKKTA